MYIRTYEYTSDSPCNMLGCLKKRFLFGYSSTTTNRTSNNVAPVIELTTFNQLIWEILTYKGSALKME